MSGLKLALQLWGQQERQSRESPPLLNVNGHGTRSDVGVHCSSKNLTTLLTWLLGTGVLGGRSREGPVFSPGYLLATVSCLGEGVMRLSTPGAPRARIRPAAPPDVLLPPPLPCPGARCFSPTVAMGTTGGFSLPERGSLLRWAVGQGTPTGASVWLCPSSPSLAPSSPPPFPAPPQPSSHRVLTIYSTSRMSLGCGRSAAPSLPWPGPPPWSALLPFSSPGPSWPNSFRRLPLPSRQSQAPDQRLLVRPPLGHSPHSHARAAAALGCRVCGMGGLVCRATPPEPHSVEWQRCLCAVHGCALKMSRVEVF